jgi:hypothetical protein
MADIFVSYRREDAGGHAGRLVDDLREHFHNAIIFQDIQSIHAGADFVQAIGQAIAASRVMLVVIGPDWLDPAAGRNYSRIHDIDDPVRSEIAWAFYHRRVVIPVLVGGARMVTAEQLPLNIRFLPQLHAHEQSVTRWSYDLQQLAAKITTVTGLVRRESGSPVSVATRRSQPRGWLMPMLWIVGGALLVTVCSVLLNAPPPDPTPPAPTPPDPTQQPAAPAPDVSGTWYEADRANPVQFEQVGTNVGVVIQLNAQQGMIAGNGQWLSGRLVLNVQAFSVPNGEQGASGVMTLTASPDQRHLTGTFELTGQSPRNISLER